MRLLMKKGCPAITGMCVWLLATACERSTSEKDQTRENKKEPIAESKAEPPPNPMAATLKSISQHPSYYTDAYIMGPGRIDWLKEQLTGAPLDADRFALHWDYAKTLLAAGESHRAVDEYHTFRDALKAFSDSLYQKNAIDIELSLATSHLRIAEQQNCLENHSPESCLFPIQAGGIHTLKEGGTQAKATLGKLLTEHPENLDALWLYNITAMTLGEYPHQVPPEWLIKPSLFESEADIGRFPNIATGTGLDINALSGGCVVDDFDNDNDLDVMMSSWNLTDSIQYFENLADGTFANRADTCGLTGITGGLNLIQGDYNNDGYVDVFVLRGAWLQKAGRHPNSLLRNNGDGTFTDVTELAGVFSFHPTQTAVWWDYNLDGHLDLFVGNEHLPRQSHPSELFHNNGDGTFTNRAAELGLSIRQYVKGVIASDYNNDGYADLYVSCLGNRNFLFKNHGPNYQANGHPKQFTEEAVPAGVSEPVESFGTWFFDYNNDGHMDLFTVGYGIKSVGDFAKDYRQESHDATFSKLYQNTGSGTFEDVTAATGLNRILLGMGINFGDLDNDGYPDFYIGTGNPDLMTLTPNRMFRNHEGSQFQEVTESGGFGHLQKGHGIAFADLDHDGDQDVLAVMGGAYHGDIYYNALFQNPGHGRAWLKLKLEGKTSNRSAIGARVKVVARDPDGLNTIYGEVNSGGSFGANPLRLELGLGNAQAINSVAIRWPGQTQWQEMRDIHPNRFYHITEGQTQPIEIALESFTIHQEPSGAHHH